MLGRNVSNPMQQAALLLTLVLGTVATADAQAIAGTWEGVTSGQRISITLDSGATGWRGTLFAPGFRVDTVRLATVMVTRDSVVLQLPADLTGAVLRGALSADRGRLDGRIIAGADSGGLFRLARRGTPAAAQLLAQIAPVRPPGPRRLYADPDSARLITSDIARFWDVFDRAPTDSLEDRLLRDYLNPGTPGLQDFIPGRIVSAADLAMQIRSRRDRYVSARAATLRVREAEPGIRIVYRSLKDLYADAVFPDVYFIIGRFNSAGTASSNGLLIGAEMNSDPSHLPALVAHELIHFQHAPSGQRTLLAQSFREGAANFLGEMISGVQNSSASPRVRPGTRARAVGRVQRAHARHELHRLALRQAARGTSCRSRILHRLSDRAVLLPECRGQTSRGS